MTSNELRTVSDFEQSLTPGKAVLVKWTAGSFGHFKAHATVKRVNRCSVRVTLTEEVSTPYGLYADGHEIVVPLLQGSLSSLKTWAHFNRCEPLGGYPAAVAVTLAGNDFATRKSAVSACAAVTTAANLGKVTS